jgi:hypothetical protein
MSLTRYKARQYDDMFAIEDSSVHRVIAYFDGNGLHAANDAPQDVTINTTLHLPAEIHVPANEDHPAGLAYAGTQRNNVLCWNFTRQEDNALSVQGFLPPQRKNLGYFRFYVWLSAPDTCNVVSVYAYKFQLMMGGLGGGMAPINDGSVVHTISCNSLEPQTNQRFLLYEHQFPSGLGNKNPILYNFKFQRMGASRQDVDLCTEVMRVLNFEVQCDVSLLLN